MASSVALSATQPMENTQQSLLSNTRLQSSGQLADAFMEVVHLSRRCIMILIGTLGILGPAAQIKPSVPAAPQSSSDLLSRIQKSLFAISVFIFEQVCFDWCSTLSCSISFRFYIYSIARRENKPIPSSLQRQGMCISLLEMTELD